MRRSHSVLMFAVLTVGMAGCTKPYFMTELDYTFYNNVSGDYDHKEYQADEGIVPAGNPRTVKDPNVKEKWLLSLQEAKSLALQYNKRIAFLGYQPGEAATNVDIQLSAFDAFFEAGGGWQRVDEQASSQVQTLGTGENVFRQDNFGNPAGAGPYGYNLTDGGESQFINPATRGRTTLAPGQHMLEMSKRNATGGETFVAYDIDYQRQRPTNFFNVVNPYWRSRLTLGIDQPLLQGAGVEFNRAPILIARANQSQAIKDFEAQVRQLLLDVETNYWQLYFTYQDLYSRETGMRQALATWQKEKNKQAVGTGAAPDVAQSLEQYQFFRVARIQALQRVLSQERLLRELLGLPPDDNRQIEPKDDPTTAEFQPNWQVAVLEMMELRPELQALRYAVRSAELAVFREKNGLLPDLTFVATYALTGLEDEWDQSLDRLTDRKFGDWYLGMRYRRQVGERTAHARLKSSQYLLSRQRATLQNQEHTYIHDLHESFQNLVANYELIQAQKDRRKAAAQQVEAREQFYLQGRTTIDVLLQAQNTFADALRDESQTVVQYNQALATWEFAKGTILANDNVRMAEDTMAIADAKLANRRRKQLARSLPYPIHAGTKIPEPIYSDPKTEQPLYSPEQRGNTLRETPMEQPPESTTPSATPRASTLPEAIPGSPIAPVKPADASPPARLTKPAEPEKPNTLLWKSRVPFAGKASGGDRYGKLNTDPMDSVELKPVGGKESLK